jgi:hypothetical protein
MEPNQLSPSAFALSVKELSSWSQTTAYFEQLARQLGKTRTLEALGQGAFQTTDGSVDSAGLPTQFGRPPSNPG